MADPEAAARDLRTLRAGPMQLIVVPALEGAARAAGCLEPDALERLFASPRAESGRAPVALLELQGGPALLLRRLHHGGLLGPLLADRFWGTGRPRRELEVTAALHAAGAPVPRPGLVIARRHWGPLRRCAVGTVFEAGCVDGLAFLESGPEPPRRLRAAAAAGDAVRRFHDAGASHPDLQIKNLLVREDDAATECLVIDLDRVTLRARLDPAERMAQLMRLYRSLRKRRVLERVGPRGLARFFGAYCAGDRELRRALRARLPRELRRVALHATQYR